MTTAAPPVFNLASYQRQLYWDDRRFLVFVAGRGVGKTTSACLRILGMIERDEIRHGARILVAAPDYTQLKDGTLKSFDRWFGNYAGDEFNPPGADIIVHKVDGNSPYRRLINDIEVWFRSAVNPDQTRSKECQIVWLDEYAQMTDEMLTLTNANLRQFGNNATYQTIITTTPRGKNHLFRRFGQHVEDARIRNITGAGEDDDPDIGAYHATTLQAAAEGVVRDGYVEGLGLTEGSQEWNQEVLAEFTAWTGLVFRQGWNKTTVLPPFRYIVGGVDVGDISPSCILLVGITEAGGYYAFKQHYESRMDHSGIAKIVGEWHREFGVNKWVIDDADLWRSLRNGGLPTAPPNKTKDAASSSVRFINSLIARGMFWVDEHECPYLVKELTTYEYKDKTSGEEVTFLDKVKENQSDHAIDALRYAVRVLSSSRGSSAYGKEVRLSVG